MTSNQWHEPVLSLVQVVRESILLTTISQQRQGCTDPTSSFTLSIASGQDRENSLGTSFCLVILPGCQTVGLLARMEPERLSLRFEFLRLLIGLRDKTAEDPARALRVCSPDNDGDVLRGVTGLFQSLPP